MTIFAVQTIVRYQGHRARVTGTVLNFEAAGTKAKLVTPRGIVIAEWDELTLIAEPVPPITIAISSEVAAARLSRARTNPDWHQAHDEYLAALDHEARF